ncbi:hypothetical protein [Paenibacillus sp. Leaf72]|uniref:hypothetical protein n=1 Tax=Paenibacillus sp. Leaf72 TaxID=1736234 RepID=UPI0006FBD9D8|nr:hypothetical protein [Paenibacillus sp. Leaf72]KQN96981.1 hypothetical protein ASF12_23215 [Paenibacillus sp. Leaf72]
MNVIIDPKEGFPASDEERAVYGSGGNGLLNGVVYFPLGSGSIPEEWIGLTVTEMNGQEVYAVPELRLFVDTTTNSKLLQKHKVQMHLQLHNVQGIILVHGVLCIRDQWPKPYLIEQTLNPSIHFSTIRALSESSVVMINLYNRCNHIETRYIENPYREQAQAIVQQCSDLPFQESSDFMQAKSKFEALVNLEYQNFNFSNLQQAVLLNFTTFSKEGKKDIRPSLQAIKHGVSIRPYAGLPEVLEPYHFYISENGHSIMCVLETHWPVDIPDDWEFPIPVKYVLSKGWRSENGYIIVEAPFHPTFGVTIDEEEYEEY